MEKIWKELSSNLKENPKATLVQTQEAGRGLVATCDLQRQEQINYIGLVPPTFIFSRCGITLESK